MRYFTGVVHEDPIERSSKATGTNAMAKVAAEATKSKEESCMMLEFD